MTLQTRPGLFVLGSPVLSHCSLLTFTDFLFLLFHQEPSKYGAKRSILFHCGWISTPLVYPQVTASHLPVPVRH